MISVSDALAHLFALADPMPSETIPLDQAAGRVLLSAVQAPFDQPPFAAASMDGYAVRDADALPGAELRVEGEAAAGRAFAGSVGPGETVRIFTGAPMPAGADRVVIQEDVLRDGATARLKSSIEQAPFVRPAGADFASGAELSAPRVLSPADVSLIAAMNHAHCQVARRPDVALIATGDELVMPGETPGRDQIIASNAFGLKALLDAAGAACRILPIARDNLASLQAVLERAADADLIVTIGGASVGDHDLMGTKAAEIGLDRDFYKIAMRPGKPLMAGRLGSVPLIGLPGNPVSALVCGTVFVAPVIRAMLGLPAEPAPRDSAQLATPLPPNGPREHYARGVLDSNGARMLDRQDSSLLTVLSAANILIIQPPNAPAVASGEVVEIVHL